MPFIAIDMNDIARGIFVFLSLPQDDISRLYRRSSDTFPASGLISCHRLVLLSCAVRACSFSLHGGMTVGEPYASRPSYSEYASTGASVPSMSARH